MEIKIGEVFKVNGIKLICIEETTDNACSNCYFNGKGCSSYICAQDERKDKKNVIFRLMETQQWSLI